MTPIRIALVLLLIGAPAAARAQEAAPDTLPLVHAPRIIVTAHRAPTAAERVASSVTVIPREEIERRQLQSVAEALRHVAGVTLVQNGGPGGVASAFLRGAGNDHALVLVDGVEVNDPSAPTRAYDFANLPTADIERIEILRGPQSTLYGSGAMGGVIQIMTRRGAGPAQATVEAEGGSFGSSHLGVTASGGRDRLSGSLTFVQRRTDGISAAPAELGNLERDAHRVRAASGRLDWRAAGRSTVHLSARIADARTDLDQGTPTGDDPNFTGRSTEWAARAWAELGPDRWRQTVAVGLAGHDRELRDDPDPAHLLDRSRGAFDGRRTTVQWLHRIELAGRLTAGAETTRETARTSFVSDGAFGPFEAVLPEVAARASGVFVQHDAALGPLSATAGIRADHHSRFGAAATWRLAPVLALGPQTRLKATLGTGFKAPSLFQLFDPEFGNSDLEAETSLGWDAGIERDLAAGRVRLGTAVFGVDYEDLVAFEFPAGYRNASRVTTRGVETFASWIPTRAVRVRAAYTHTRARDRSGGEDDGLPLIRRPRHAAHAGVEWAAPRADLALDLRMVGAREDVDFTEFPARRVTLGGTTLVRLAGSWALTDGVRLLGRIENALDRDYREVFGFGTPGRAVYAGIRAAF